MVGGGRRVDMVEPLALVCALRRGWTRMMMQPVSVRSPLIENAEDVKKKMILLRMPGGGEKEDAGFVSYVGVLVRARLPVAGWHFTVTF